MTSPLIPLLESFYERLEPRGVGFVGSATFGASFGRSPTSFTLALGVDKGFMQLHLEDEGLSVYSSNFGSGRVLVAQFGFQEDFPPPRVRGLPLFGLLPAG
jgi:hypothetical protein